MGYQTDFEGKFKLNKQLTIEDQEWLTEFNDADHRDEVGMPGNYCQWVGSRDGWFIEWDENEKFYDYIEWIKYLIKNFFEPKGYVLNGTVEWEGEEKGDIGRIIIKDNEVTIKEAKISFD